MSADVKWPILSSGVDVARAPTSEAPVVLSLATVADPIVVSLASQISKEPFHRAYLFSFSQYLTVM